MVIGEANILLLGLVDWKTGFELNFFVFYVLPVWIGGWYLGLETAMAFAVLSALTWFGADVLSGHTYASHLYAVWNTMIRLVSFLTIGWSVFMMRQARDRERNAAESLRQALSEVKVLVTFIPICAQCKKIRTQEGVWQHLEVYLGEHSNSRFSHGYCPECARKAMEEIGLIGVEPTPAGPAAAPPARRT